MISLLRFIGQHAKAAALLLVIGIALIIGLLNYCHRLNTGNHVGITVDNRIDITPQQIQSIRDMGEWEFLAIDDEELVDSVKPGLFIDAELARIYYGTLRLGINLGETRQGWIRVEHDSVIVATLPPIRLLSQDFIDEARSRSFFQKGKWTPQDMKRLYDIAHRKMLQRCMTRENIDVARENARRQFTQLLKSMGYKNVSVEFEKEKRK